MEKLLSTKEVGEILGVRSARVCRYIKDGRLSASKPGGNGKSKRHWRIKPVDLEAFVSGNTEVESAHAEPSKKLG